MSKPFYHSVIEEEKSFFNVKEEALRKAASNVSAVYSPKALTKGKTYLDYNNPQNRCAYLYKFSVIHTNLVTKFFKNMLSETTANSILKSRNDIKICCLGGGPGTDVIGILTALAQKPGFTKKVVEVTVLDICGGWRNSFKHIISKLLKGEFCGIPSAFIDPLDFKYNLVQVDLLKPLPSNVLRIISEADILCMVKFVSAILSKEGSISALQVIGQNIKEKAIVLFIDNCSKTKFSPLIDAFEECGFISVLGPLLHGCGCVPKKARKSFRNLQEVKRLSVTVVGWIKTFEHAAKESASNVIDQLLDAKLVSMDEVEVADDEIEGSDLSQFSLNDAENTEIEVLDSFQFSLTGDEDTEVEALNYTQFFPNSASSSNTASNIAITCDKATQTETNLYNSEVDSLTSSDIEELTVIINTLSNLLPRVKSLKQATFKQTCCSNCSC